MATTKAFFRFTCSAFNKFARANRALACSTHSGVTCHPSSPVRSTAKIPQPLHRTPGGQQRPPQGAPIHHTPRSRISPRIRNRKARLSDPDHGRNRARETPSDQQLKKELIQRPASG
jgi:hypothetical protein